MPRPIEMGWGIINVRIICAVLVLAFFMGTAPVLADEAEFKKGVKLYKKKKYTSAETALIKALASEGLSVENQMTANILLGRIHLTGVEKRWKGRSLEAARQYLDKAVELGPDNLKSHYWRGRVLHSMGLSQEAFKDYDKALEIKPFTAGFYMRAILHENSGALDLALEDINQAVKLSPAWPWYYLKRARINRLSGQFESAFSDLDRAWQEGIPEGVFHLEKGRIFSVMRHFQMGLGEFARSAIVASGNYDMDSFQDRAYVYLLTGEDTLAEDTINYMVSNGLNNKNWKKFVINMSLVRLLYLKQGNPFEKSRMARLKDKLDPDGWTLKALDFIEGKLSEEKIFEYVDALSDTSHNNHLRQLTRYLAAEKRLLNNDEKGGQALLQSVAVGSQNRVMGTLAEARIRQVKNRPPAIAKPLPPSVAAELPMMAEPGSAPDENVWEWAFEPQFIHFAFFPNNGMNLFRGGMVSVKEGMRYSLITTEGTRLYEKLRRPVYVDEMDFFNIFYPDRCEYRNNKNDLIFESKMVPCTAFNLNGIRRSKKDGQWCLVDMKDQILAMGDFKNIGQGMWAKFENKMYAIADEKGELLTPVKFKTVSKYREDAVWVSEEGKKGYFLDKQGKRLFETPQSFSKTWFQNGYAQIFIKKKGYVLVDKFGKQLGNQVFKNCSLMDSQGLVQVVTLKGKRGFMDRSGKFLKSPPEQQGKIKWEDIRVYQVYKGPGNRIEGLMDSRGNVILPARFEEIKGSFNNQAALWPEEAALLTKIPLLPVSYDFKEWGYLRLKAVE